MGNKYHEGQNSQGRPLSVPEAQVNVYAEGRLHRYVEIAEDQDYPFIVRKHSLIQGHKRHQQHAIALRQIPFVHQQLVSLKQTLWYG